MKPHHTIDLTISNVSLEGIKEIGAFLGEQKAWPVVLELETAIAAELSSRVAGETGPRVMRLAPIHYPFEEVHTCYSVAHLLAMNVSDRTAFEFAMGVCSVMAATLAMFSEQIAEAGCRVTVRTAVQAMQQVGK